MRLIGKGKVSDINQFEEAFCWSAKATRQLSFKNNDKRGKFY